MEEYAEDANQVNSFPPSLNPLITPIIQQPTYENDFNPYGTHSLSHKSNSQVNIHANLSSRPSNLPAKFKLTKRSYGAKPENGEGQISQRQRVFQRSDGMNYMPSSYSAKKS